MTTQEVTEQVRDISNKLRACFADDKKLKALMAFQRFNEYLLRLENRHNELLHIEAFTTNVDPKEFEKHGITPHDAQLLFIDKTEAFHQQVYATVSAFIMLLSHATDKKFTAQMPIDSVTKFLRHMSDKSYDSLVKDHSAALIKSVDFRSKFIDHPQQHALHDWMTISYIKGTCIVYFLKKDDKVYFRPHADPYASDFRPPFDCDSFYVSPKHSETFEAVKIFTIQILSSLEQSNQK